MDSFPLPYVCAYFDRKESELGRDVTERLNHVYADDDDRPDPFLRGAAARTLVRDEW